MEGGSKADRLGSTLSDEATKALEAAQTAETKWRSTQHTKQHLKAYKAFLIATRDLYVVLHIESTMLQRASARNMVPNNPT